jgi:hypothetical protein
MLRRVTFVRIAVPEERIASIIKETIFGELGTTLASVASAPNLVTLMMEAIISSETSVLTRATERHILEGGILHSHRCENLKSCTIISNIYTVACSM